MLALLVAATLTAAPSCTTVKQACRACTGRGATQVCSTPGIACQPELTVCRRPPAKPPKGRTAREASATSKGG